MFVIIEVQKPFGPRIFDGCKEYRDNPVYRYLTSGGHSFGGSEKYCYKPAFSTLPTNPTEVLIDLYDIIQGVIPQMIPLLIINLIFELPIFYLLGFKKIIPLFIIFLANVFSTTLFLLMDIFLFHYLSLGIFGNAIIGEVIVITTEILILRTVIKEPSFRYLIKAVLMANITSATVGTMTLFIAQSLGLL